MGKFPIETERLVLRPFKKSDAFDYLKLTLDEDIHRYVPYACPSDLKESQSNIKEYYMRADFYHDFYLVIEAKATHKMVGSLIVTQNMNHEYEMSLIISNLHRRKGYMSEALKSFIDTMPRGSELLFRIEKDNKPSYGMVSKIRGIKDISSCYKGIYAFKLTT